MTRYPAREVDRLRTARYVAAATVLAAALAAWALDGPGPVALACALTLPGLVATLTLTVRLSQLTVCSTSYSGVTQVGPDCAVCGAEKVIARTGRAKRHHVPGGGRHANPGGPVIRLPRLEMAPPRPRPAALPPVSVPAPSPVPVVEEVEEMHHEWPEVAPTPEPVRLPPPPEPEQVDEPEEDERALVSHRWAEDWNSTEDATYDEPAPAVVVVEGTDDDGYVYGHHPTECAVIRDMEQGCYTYPDSTCTCPLRDDEAADAESDEPVVESERDEPEPVQADLNGHAEHASEPAPDLNVPEPEPAPAAVAVADPEPEPERADDGSCVACPEPAAWLLAWLDENGHAGQARVCPTHVNPLWRDDLPGADTRRVSEQITPL